MFHSEIPTALSVSHTPVASMLLLNWNPTTTLTADSIHLDDLQISFHRTIRVPDNHETHALPPSLGCFPLSKVADYTGKLPAKMAQKGGLFFPMYRKSRQI